MKPWKEEMPLWLKHACNKDLLPLGRFACFGVGVILRLLRPATLGQPAGSIYKDADGGKRAA
jgi:hypothetical protein